jgi:Ribbon-helix-helix protein, copG family
MTPKRAATFRLEDELVEALQILKDRDGIPVTEQIRRAVKMWLESKGIEPSPRPRRASPRRKA